MAIGRREFLLATAAAAGRRPNIVFILADDLGYGDLGCYNPRSRIPTPNLDRMAERGVRFTDAHTPSAVCTPTRYGLLTGRYCWRTSLKSGVFDGFDPPLIEPERTTVASYLKRHGYATACIGKWHLGMQWHGRDGSPVSRRTEGGFRPGYEVDYTRPAEGGPNAVGFDYSFGISASLDMPPYCFIENGRTVGIPDVKTPESRDLFLNQPPGLRTADFALEKVVPACTAKAVEWIGRQRGPYFLYLPLSSPHLPIVPNREFEGVGGAGKYGEFVAEMDAAVGRVLDAVDENTLVLFSSDNGGLWHWWDARESDDAAGGKITPRGDYVKRRGHQGNAAWRGTKADIWEGGHRVPLIARWPGRIRAGRVATDLVCLTDLLATAAEIAGTPLRSGEGPDSVSMLPALEGKAGRRRSLVMHSLHGEFAIREGEWKLCLTRGSGGFSVPRTGKGEPDGQLYNLVEDPLETRNRYGERPDVVKRLREQLERVKALQTG